MITLKNWRLEIPPCERSLGYEGENLSSRLEIETDTGPEWLYYLDMEYSDGTFAALPLTWEEGKLWAELPGAYLSIPGEVTVNIRAEAGVVKKSDMGFLFVSDSVVSGEAPPEPVPPPGGVTDHRQLTHRDAEGQHPVEAIEGLAEELRRIPAPVEPLTNEDLEELLK